jgi:hypothetical protein
MAKGDMLRGAASGMGGPSFGRQAGNMGRFGQNMGRFGAGMMQRNPQGQRFGQGQMGNTPAMSFGNMAMPGGNMYGGSMFGGGGGGGQRPEQVPASTYAPPGMMSPAVMVDKRPDDWQSRMGGLGGQMGAGFPGGGPIQEGEQQQQQPYQMPQMGGIMAPMGRSMGGGKRH